MANEILTARANGSQKFPPHNVVDINQKILVAHINDKEILSIPIWLKNFSNFLNSNPNDATFRNMMSKNNSAGLWVKRPNELARLDVIVQEFPHHETVGNHIYSVVQALNTETNLNGINYLADPRRKGIKKALRSAAFFHDIAKVNDVADLNHPLHSADIAESYLKAMNFSQEEVWMCYFLIKNHDLIGKTVNRKDPTEIGHLVDICHGFPTILQCLRDLTVADISSIPKLQEITPYNIINDVNKAVRLAYKEIKDRNSRKTKPYHHFPIIKIFSPLKIKV